MSHAISLCCILRRSCSKISSFHCSALKTDPGERSPHTCSVRGPRSIFMSDHCRSSLPFESHLRNRLPTTIRNRNTRLQIAINVHQPPLILPFLPLFIEFNLPRLIKRLEPEVIRAIRQSLTDPIVHERVHLCDARHGPIGAGGSTTAPRATGGWPSCLGDDVFGDVGFENDVVVLPEIPRRLRLQQEEQSLAVPLVADWE